MKTIQDFANKLQAETLQDLNTRYPDNLEKYPDMWVKDSIVTIKPGKKYTKVDVGRSGKYMVVNETGEIFGIKGYGVIHFGHFYGTLETIDDYFWGRYDATKINNAPIPKVMERVKDEPKPIKQVEPDNIIHLSTVSREVRRQIRLNKAAETNDRNCKRNGFPMYY